MYVIVEYKLTKEDSGSKTFTPVRVVDTSETIDKFKHLIYSESIFKATGYCDVSNLYRGHKKIIMDIEKTEKEHGTLYKIRKLIRKRKLEYLLD